jgi:hypothetical protein
MGLKRGQKSLVRKPTRVHELDKKRIVIVDQFLGSNDFASIQKLCNTGYHTQMVSTPRGPIRETSHSSVLIDLKKFSETKLLKKIAEQIFANYNCNVESVTRVYVTQSHFGENSLIHQDGNKGKDKSQIGLTAVIFINDKWEREWGGELTFFDKNRDAVFCVAPKPGRIVISPSASWHRSGIPSRLYYDYRMSLVVMVLAKKVKSEVPQSKAA